MSMPADWFALAALVFVLGLKHGLDADHLVAIDGLTRFNIRARPALARWCGTLFSLGHGLVVIAVAVVVGTAAESWIVPGWIEDVGVWISIAFLTVLGLANLFAVLTTPPGDVVQTVAVKGRLLGRLTRTTHPLGVVSVGALFAFSFDTMSQAALFAVTASQFGGWQHGALLGLTFMLGMLIADGANGVWIASLLRKADRRARMASRVMGLAVACLSLAVAAFGAAKYFAPAVDAWTEGRELAIGLGVIVFIAGTFALTLVSATRSPRTAVRREAVQPLGNR
jgi:high-affinity nickel-transport protein